MVTEGVELSSWVKFTAQEANSDNKPWTGDYSIFLGPATGPFFMHTPDDFVRSTDGAHP